MSKEKDMTLDELLEAFADHLSTKDIIQMRIIRLWDLCIFKFRKRGTK